jgi:hypothetical protein
MTDGLPPRVQVGHASGKVKGDLNLAYADKTDETNKVTRVGK